jgi:hypothetical protein
VKAHALRMSAYERLRINAVVRHVSAEIVINVKDARLIVLNMILAENLFGNSRNIGDIEG